MMNKNVKIAKELVILAKSLVAIEKVSLLDELPDDWTEWTGTLPEGLDLVGKEHDGDLKKNGEYYTLDKYIFDMTTSWAAVRAFAYVIQKLEYGKPVGKKMMSPVFRTKYDLAVYTNQVLDTLVNRDKEEEREMQEEQANVLAKKIGKYNNFTGKIQLHPDNAKVKDADFYICRTYDIIDIYWKNGIWENGIMRFDEWKDGTWKDGIWKRGMWKKGIWENGTWRDGTWVKGTWKNGTWKYGTWEDGTWKDGTWEGGEWDGGTWEKGTWEDGTWMDGTWKDGIWNDGRWIRGKWEGGVWNGGRDGKNLYHPKNDSPDKWLK